MKKSFKPRDVIVFLEVTLQSKLVIFDKSLRHNTGSINSSIKYLWVKAREKGKKLILIL